MVKCVINLNLCDHYFTKKTYIEECHETKVKYLAGPWVLYQELGRYVVPLQSDSPNSTTRQYSTSNEKVIRTRKVNSMQIKKWKFYNNNCIHQGRIKQSIQIMYK